MRSRHISRVIRADRDRVYDVVLPSGTVVTNPLRVLAHPHGSEVVFTVRQIELTDEEFDRDCQTVAADLDRLAGLVEERSGG
ncbi:hypothetical protein [uncultured Serinicoccus sp.]|uniref:hypothetical protein n=1 Tax=uncultured Serinicoccus sp. TaxID=735514 RepID=UPI002639191B|nr:hypothetical protein [uncultured Serinicoccus sp.]